MAATKKVEISRDWFKDEAKPVKSRRVAGFERYKVTKSEELPQLLTQQEAATFLRRHVKTIEEYRKDGLLRFEKLKNRYFTTPEWIADFIEQEALRNG